MCLCNVIQQILGTNEKRWHRKKFIKKDRRRSEMWSVRLMSGQTDRQTDAEIDTLIAIIRSAAGTRAISHRTTKHFGLDRLCRLRAGFSTAN